MRTIIFSRLGYLGVLFFISQMFFSPSSAASREYLPGDFVHVIVEAPLDTAQMNAVMPDGTIINLVQERRKTSWRGIWQVPLDFKKGTYSSKLTAVDLEGNIFEGLSDSFTVGELAVVTLVNKPTEEIVSPALHQKITVEVPALTGIPEKKVISLPRVAQTPEIKPGEKLKLIERNLISAKSSLAENKFSEAMAYLRVVLFLDPKHKEGALYLAQAQKKESEKSSLKSNSNREFSPSLLLAIIFGTAALLWLVQRFAFAKKLKDLKTYPIPEKEKHSLWFKKSGWTKNPFTQNTFSSFFSGFNTLQADALKNFIKARIEDAGGRGLQPFTESALNEIHAAAKGKPREALNLCDSALDKAIEQNADLITAEFIKSLKETGTPNILIADDEEVVLTTLEGILKLGGGYKTDTALDGEETLKKLKENSYDLLLLDIQMPKIDGHEVLKRIRTRVLTLPVVFVTGGRGDPAETLKCFAEYNLTSYIQKPFTPEKVLDVVAKALKIC